MERIEDFAQDLLIHLFDCVSPDFPNEIILSPPIRYMKTVNTAVDCFRKELYVDLEHLFINSYRVIDSDDDFTQYVTKHCRNISPGHHYKDWILICTFVAELIHYSFESWGCVRFFHTASKCLTSIFNAHFKESFNDIGGWQGFEWFCFDCTSAFVCLQTVKSAQDSTNDSSPSKECTSRKKYRNKKGSKQKTNSENGPSNMQQENKLDRTRYFPKMHESANANSCSKNVNQSSIRNAECMKSSFENDESFAECQVSKRFTMQYEIMFTIFTLLRESCKKAIQLNLKVAAKKKTERNDSCIQIRAEHDASSLRDTVEKNAGSLCFSTNDNDIRIFSNTEDNANSITILEDNAEGITTSESAVSGIAMTSENNANIMTSSEDNAIAMVTSEDKSSDITSSEVKASDISSSADKTGGMTSPEDRARGILNITENDAGNIRCVAKSNAIDIHSTAEEAPHWVQNIAQNNEIGKLGNLYCTAEDDSDSLYFSAEDDSDCLYSAAEDEAHCINITSKEYVNGNHTITDNVVSRIPSKAVYPGFLQTEVNDLIDSTHTSVKDKSNFTYSTKVSASNGKTILDYSTVDELKNLGKTAMDVDSSVPCNDSQIREKCTQHKQFHQIPENIPHNSEEVTEKVSSDLQMLLERELDWEDVLIYSDDEDWRQATDDDNIKWWEGISDSDSDCSTTFSVQTSEENDLGNAKTAAQVDAGCSPTINPNGDKTIDAAGNFKSAAHENQSSICEENVKSITSGVDEALNFKHEGDGKNLISFKNDAYKYSRIVHQCKPEGLGFDDENTFPNNNVASVDDSKISDIYNESKQSPRKLACSSENFAVTQNANAHTENEIPIVKEKLEVNAEFSMERVKSGHESFHSELKSASSRVNDSSVRNTILQTENDIVLTKLCSVSTFTKIASMLSKAFPYFPSSDIVPLTVLLFKSVNSITANTSSQHPDRIIPRRRLTLKFSQALKSFLGRKCKFSICERCKCPCFGFVHICLNLYKSKYLPRVKSLKNSI